MSSSVSAWPRSGQTSTIPATYLGSAYEIAARPTRLLESQKTKALKSGPQTWIGASSGRLYLALHRSSAPRWSIFGRRLHYPATILPTGNNGRNWLKPLRGAGARDLLEPRNSIIPR
jgi:hypothetical protein